ncbi:MAG: hypothetical protein QM765_51775 [Myxococcales bacterium]
MDTSDAAVERAFQEWCAMMGVNPLLSGKPGGFRLARDERGAVFIEQLGEQGEVQAVCPPMTSAELVAAIHFVHTSMNIKTVQIARTVAQKRKPRF